MKPLYTCAYSKLFQLCFSLHTGGFALTQDRFCPQIITFNLETTMRFERETPK